MIDNKWSDSSFPAVILRETRNTKTQAKPTGQYCSFNKEITLVKIRCKTSQQLGKLLPSPGIRVLITKQIQANGGFKIGMAPFIIEMWSTRLASIFGLSCKNALYLSVWAKDRRLKVLLPPFELWDQCLLSYSSYCYVGLQVSAFFDNTSGSYKVCCTNC